MWHFQQKKKLPRKEVYMKTDTMHSPSSSTHFIVKTWSWGKRQISLISWHNCSTVICGSMYVIITSLGKEEKIKLIFQCHLNCLHRRCCQ
jgi:hypothetical protein